VQDLFLIAFGVLFLFLGGDGMVRSTVAIAEKLKLSNLVISTVIIGFGTSLPELLVSLSAALDGFPQIAIGNVVGSNISNSLLVLGVAAFITTIHCQNPQIKKDAAMGFIATLFLVLLSFIGIINRITGIFMLLTIISYLTYIIMYKQHEISTHKKEYKKIDKAIEKQTKAKQKSLISSIIITLLSLVILVIGAKLLINGAVSIAKSLGISNAVIGLTLVALGTSIPELATASIAAWRKHTDIVIGNILGSNLFNILSILGITAIVKPIPFIGQIASQDVWVMLAISIMVLLLINFRGEFSRFNGLLFLVTYVLYIYWLFFI